MSGIQDWLPSFDVGERHEATLPLRPEQALQRLLSSPVAPDPLVRGLMRLRGLRPGGSIEEFMAAHGFLLLERTPTSYVVGMYVGRDQAAVTDAASWLATAAPRSLKIATDFRSEPTAGGARLITETRIAATGLLARVVFQCYWLVVGPFSSLIRRRWLRAVVTAQKAAPER